MLSSFFSGISGLLANSNAINVVSNNIANVNTVGFKGSTANFQDVLYQSINSASGTSQVGRGTALSSIDTNFSAGSLETTTSGTDLAIGGKGFFIVKATTSQNTYYTRAGQFSFDADGNLTDPNGYILQGRQIDRTTSTPIGVDGDITISQAPSEPKATGSIDMNVNLQSDSAWAGTIGDLSTTGAVTGVIASSSSYPASGPYTLAYDGAGNLMVSVDVTDLDGNVTGTQTHTEAITAGQTYEDFGGLGLDITIASSLPAASGNQLIDITGFSVDSVSTTQTPATTSNYSSSVTAYDSMGQAHIVNIYFRKSGESATGQSTWEWIAELDAADSVTNANAIADWGTLVFNNNGALVSGGDAQSVLFDFSQGASQNQNIDLVFGPGTGGGTTTQYPISSTTSYQTQDGYPPGVLQSVSVSAEGILSGTYSNGQILDLYQITLANFNNANGLYKEGSNLYSETLASGVAYTNSPGEGGLGKISANSLEQSNVDLATEFVKMIIAQRGFQANSKVITTTDEILQELMTLKR
jgi:flagellar hook protein FlgE